MRIKQIGEKTLMCIIAPNENLTEIHKIQITSNSPNIKFKWACICAREAVTIRERERERERDWTYSPPHFTSPWHPKASPKLLVKKKKKKLLCDDSNSSGSHFPAFPANYWLWYFSHHQPLCRVCFIHRRVHFLFPWSSSITPLPPTPRSLTPSSTSLSCPLSPSTICSRLPPSQDWLSVKLAVFHALVLAEAERCICHCNYCQPCGQKARLAFSHFTWVCLNLRK